MFFFNGNLIKLEIKYNKVWGLLITPIIIFTTVGGFNTIDCYNYFLLLPKDLFNNFLHGVYIGDERERPYKNLRRD